MAKLKGNLLQYTWIIIFQISKNHTFIHLYNKDVELTAMCLIYKFNSLQSGAGVINHQ